MTLGIYDSDNAGTKEDLREAADSLINGFENWITSALCAAGKERALPSAEECKLKSRRRLN